MLPFRKILFPVDFSEPCRHAAPQVRAMLDRYSAQLLLVNAVNPAPLAVGPPEAPIFYPPPHQTEIYQQHLDHLHRFAAEHFPSRKPDLQVAVGDPPSVIEDTLRHHGADLVMLPTHGHGVVRRLLLGSVTSKVLHDADCAVWTATHDAARAGLRCHHVLCAASVDQEDSAAVLRAAASLAQTYGAELRLLHAVDLPDAGLEYAYREAIMAAADHRLRELRQETGVHAPYDVVAGDPVEQTRLAAIQHGSGLIVTGRGRARARAGRLWSQLYSLIRESPCPVLSV
ncbi:MAG: universal stress protein [Bryobacteraceae bacterium]|nr:universal stress protein [Bryobacteraceae bacterium]